MKTTSGGGVAGIWSVKVLLASKVGVSLTANPNNFFLLVGASAIWQGRSVLSSAVSFLVFTVTLSQSMARLFHLKRGIPAIFGHFLTTLPAVHSMIIFVCIKYVPVPVVPQTERFLFRRACPKSYHIFRCIARYGYKDVRKENHQMFEQLLIESLEKFIRREAQELLLESDGDYDSDSEDEYPSSRSLIAPNGSPYSLGAPLLANFNDAHNSFAESSTSGQVKPEDSMAGTSFDNEQSLEKELSFIRKAKESGVVYLLGHGDIRAKKSSWFIKKLVINYFYAFLRKNCRRGITNLSVPPSNLMQVGMTYMV